jgi:hypothetical protein
LSPAGRKEEREMNEKCQDGQPGQTKLLADVGQLLVDALDLGLVRFACNQRNKRNKTRSETGKR